MLCCCYCFSPLLLKVLLSYMSPTLFVCLQHLQTSSFPRCHLPLPSLSRHFFMPEIQKLSAESRKNSADVVNSVEVQTSKFYSIFFSAIQVSTIFLIFFLLNHNSWNRLFFLHLIPVRNFLVLDRQ